MCEEQTKNLPKVYILTDLFSAVVHKTAATDSFMNWTDLEFSRQVIWMVFMIF